MTVLFQRLPDPTTVPDPATKDYIQQLVRALNANLNRTNNVNVPWFFGEGSPEGVVTTTVGSLYSDLDGTPLATLWVKEVGDDAFGWSSLASADGLIAEIETDISDLESTVSTIESEITTINSEISTINSEITTINSELAGLVDTNKHTLGFSSTSPSVGQQGSYIVIPAAATITGWSIAVDAGTATVQVWKIASGTAVPTVANSINTVGVSIASGTAIISSTLTDFTTTSIASDDIFAFNLSAVSGVTRLDFQLFVTTS
jgi:hypothetical protein